jgi:putative phosphoribosyl transferase
VLLVDDGVATGATFFASVKALKRFGLKRLVGAIPVGPEDTLRDVRREVDDLIVLETPDPFFAVGNHYVDFSQAEDAAVVRYLVDAAAALREEARA